MDFYDELMRVFTLDNTPLLVVSAITFLFGYLEYVYSFALMWKEHRAPYPVWMHTFYLAHDSSWAAIMLWTAAHHGWNWFFTTCGVALMIWNFFEVFNIWKAITVERQEIWGDYHRGPVSTRYAAFNVAVQVAAFYCLVNILIGFMGAGSILQWFLFTNMLIAAAPGVLWARRGVRDGSRRGTSMGLAILILIATVNTFLPSSMWVLAMPEVFDKPWYYVTGVVFTLIAALNLYQLSRLPAKTEPRAIW
ncbi:hypothetical protein [Actinoplanes sp. NPDC051851]|uniref:hypothetical protein n=1 Tax=Actinoplanes sp. NPDC051851 TaxID=3154753 RepID=UPI003425CAEE